MLQSKNICDFPTLGRKTRQSVTTNNHRNHNVTTTVFHCSHNEPKVRTPDAHPDPPDTTGWASRNWRVEPVAVECRQKHLTSSEIVGLSRVMGVAEWLDDLFGKIRSINYKWMMTGGTPMYGNPHISAHRSTPAETSCNLCWRISIQVPKQFLESWKHEGRLLTTRNQEVRLDEWSFSETYHFEVTGIWLGTR